MRERRAYRNARRLPKGKERTAAFRAARRSVEFTDAAIQGYTVKLRQQAFCHHLDVHTTQKLASRAFAAVNTWLLGKHGRPRFKGYRQLDTLEGKSNHAGLPASRRKKRIRWRDGAVEWKGLTLSAILHPRDPVVSYALGCRVKYVRLVRRKLDGQDRFYVQLILEGVPYQKPEHEISEGPSAPEVPAIRRSPERLPRGGAHSAYRLAVDGHSPVASATTPGQSPALWA